VSERQHPFVLSYGSPDYSLLLRCGRNPWAHRLPATAWRYLWRQCFCKRCGRDKILLKKDVKEPCGRDKLSGRP
jgi:hypothetical protein